MKYHCAFYSTAKSNLHAPYRCVVCIERASRHLQKWIDDLHSINHPPVLHVFGEQHAASRLSGAMNDKRVPIGKTTQTVKIDRGENIVDRWFDKVKSRIELNLATGHAWVEFHLSGDSKKILAEHLKRNHSTALSSMLQNQLYCSFLLDGIGLVFCIDENIGVKECSRKPRPVSAHPFNLRT